VLPEDSSKEILEIDTAGQIAVRSNAFEIDNKRNIVTFTGDVDARRDDLTINCQKMLLYFRNNPGDEDSGKGKISVDKIVATGEVKVIRTDGGLAMAKKTVYYQDNEN
jgi:lipopolysaccharide export system protein LptA